MKKISLFKIGLLIFAVVLTIFQSCTEDNIEIEESYIKLEEQPIDQSHRLVESMSFETMRYNSLRRFPIENNDNTILVYSSLSDPETGELWNDAITRAINNWNIDQNGNIIPCLNIKRTFNENEANIRIFDASPPMDGTNTHPFGDERAPNADEGDYHSIIFINTGFRGGNTTDFEKQSIMAHEIGHSLGLQHNEDFRFPAIPEIEATLNSLMSVLIVNRGDFEDNQNNSLTDADRAAYKFIYEDIANCETIDLPDEDETNDCVPPTPNTIALISGPNTLNTYQSGVFHTSENNFEDYNSVQWVVYSNTFQNAGQHFSIQNPSGNNEFQSVVEVLPSAPAGNYTIQCRVTNECGTYYIDKTFNVVVGPPTLFDL